jgi:diacylglycerol kinase family enzyme
LGVHGRENHALETLIHGTVRTIDSGLANGFPFFNVMGVGFDAEISHRFSTLTSRGLPAYCRTTLSAYFGFRPERYVIRDDQNRVELTAFLIAVANSDQYGNNCFIAPGATVDDGCLNLTALKPLNLLNALPVAARLFNKTIDGSSAAVRLRSAHFIIERQKSGFLHTDGEAHETGASIDVSVRPKSLRIMVPTVAAPT